MAKSTTAAIRAGRAFVELFVNDARLVKGLRAAEARVLAFGKKMQAIGQKMMSMGLAAAAPMGIAVKTFVGFDDQMRAVQATLGGTAAEFEMLTEKAKLLGRTTSFTAAQVAASMLELARAGFDSGEIDSAIAGILNLSRATGTSLAESANIAGNALRGFQLEASQMNRVSDVLVATANSAALTLIDLGESLKEVAPIARTAGMSLEDTVKVIGALSNFGIKGTQAGNSIKRILINMVDPKVKPIYESLGVSTAENGKMRELSAVLRDVAIAVKDMPNAERLEIFAKLFDMRGLASGASLTAAEFDKLIEAIDNAAGTADRQAKLMDAGIGGMFRILASAAEGAAIAIGEVLSGEITKFGQSLTETITNITNWINANKASVVWFTKVIAKTIAYGAALVVLGKTAQTLIGVITGVRAAIMALGAASTLLYATPYAAALLAIGAAFYYVYQKTSQSLTEIQKWNDQIEKLKEIREKGNQQRKYDMLQMERLKQLAAQEQINNEQMQEASDIVADLTSKYGDLGAVIDETANSLKLAADSMERMQQIMAKQAIDEINQQINAYDKELDAIRKKEKERVAQLDPYYGRRSRNAGPVDDSNYIGLSDWISDNVSDASLEDLRRQRKGIEEKKLQKIADRDAITANDPDSLTGVAKEEKLQKAIDQGAVDAIENQAKLNKLKEESAEAEKKIADLTRKFSRERQTQLKNEIDDIREETLEYKKLLDVLLAAERAKAEPDAEKASGYMYQMQHADAIADERINRVRQKHAKEYDLEINADGMAITDLKLDLSDVQNKRDQAKEAGDTQSAKRLDIQAKTIEAAIANAEKDKAIKDINTFKEQRSALSQAYSDATQSGDKEAAATLAEKLRELESRLGSAMSNLDRIRSGSETAQEKLQISTMSTFFASAVRGLGASTTLDAIANNTRETAKNTKNISKQGTTVMMPTFTK